MEPIVVKRQWPNQKTKNEYIKLGYSNKIELEQTKFGTLIKAPYQPSFSNKLLLKYGENKFKILRKLSTAFLEVFQFIFLIGTKSPIYFAAEEYLKNNKVDIIIATGEPFVLFHYASKLSKKHGIPWVADYRDPWSNDLVWKNNIILKKYFSIVEKRILKTAQSAITVSEFVKQKIQEVYPKIVVAVCPNGFDEEAIEATKNIHQETDVLTLIHAGTLYEWHPYKRFFEALNEFLTENSNTKIQVHFYGLNNEEKIKNIIDSNFPKLNPSIVFFPKTPNQELLIKMKKSNVMLLFNYYSFMGTKIYDYLAIHRKILLCFENDIEAKRLKQKYYTIQEPKNLSNHLQRDLILETQSGIVVQDYSDLKIQLQNLAEEFKTKKQIDCNSVGVDQFSRKIQAKIICEEVLFSSNKRPYQICNRCVLDTSDPFIEFDKNGNCNHCNDYISRISTLAYSGDKSDQKLKAMVDELKQAGKNKKYDCIIGISGGIDSCYVAYLCKNLGLRPLAVHMDNGWNSEEAVHNIYSVCEKLGIDYQSYVLDWQEFKDIQLAFLKASIVEIEIPTDIAIQGALHQVAAKFGIKYIISGGNYATEGLLPNSWFYNPKDSKLLKAIHKQFGTREMRTFPYFDFLHEMYYKFVKGIKIKYILNDVPFSKKDAMEILEKDLDWKYYGGKHYESKFTGFVQSYIQPVKFGIDYRRATLATQICAGTTSREDALKELEKPSYNDQSVKNETEYLCKKFDISVEEFNEILKRPVKTYRDYPNNEKVLNFIYNTYKKILRK